jgi:lysozyme
MTISTVAELIEQHEGRKNLAYQDSRGFWTVGVGHNLQAKPLSDAAVDLIRDEDIQDAMVACVAIFGDVWASLAAPRQAALVDMAFQLGEAGLRKFERLIAAIQLGQWDTAAAEALSSDWATETSERAKCDAQMILSGLWPEGETS